MKRSRCQATPAAASRRLLLAFLALAALTPGASGQEPATPIKQLVQDVGIDQRLGAQVPLDLDFRDEGGRPVKLQQYFRDKPIILSLVYYECPMLCTQVLNGLLKTSQALRFQMGDEYEVITVSFDPRETPRMAAAKKERYARAYRRPGADEGWHFLTGRAPAIEELARTVGFRYRFEPRTNQFAHASGIVVLTPDGKVSRYFYGIEYPPTDLRLALVESSAGRIGSAVDQVLLLCYHYDPATGRYGFVIENVLRLAGVATVLALGSFIVIMYRRERRLAREMAPAIPQSS